MPFKQAFKEGPTGGSHVEVPPDLLLIEARRLQLAKDQRDHLLGQVLRAVAGQRDLGAVAHVESVPRFLPRGESKPVVPEPSFHVSTIHLVGHRAFHEVYTDGDWAAASSAPQEAREHLTTARTMYREMDLRFWREQAEAEMREL